MMNKTWLRRAGLVGFLFFLGKGILWLLAAGVVFEGCRRAN